METAMHEDPARKYGGFEGIPISIRIRVGRTQSTLRELQNLEEGELLLLKHAVGAPFDLLSGEILLAKVELVATEQGVAIKLVSAADGDDDEPAE